MPTAPMPTHKVCRDCHITKPIEEFSKRHGECRICSRAVAKAYNQAHPEQVRTRRQVRHLAHKDEENAKSKAYYLTHGPSIRAKAKARYQEQAEQLRAYANAYSQTHREEKRAYLRAWNAAHPEKRKAIKAHRRARIAGAAINDFTAAQWREMQAHYDHRCVYCGKRAKGHLTQDHITPLAKGGNHTKSNIVPACQSCNRTKGTRAPLVAVQPLLL